MRLRDTGRSDATHYRGSVLRGSNTRLPCAVVSNTGSAAPGALKTGGNPVPAQSAPGPAPRDRCRQSEFLPQPNPAGYSGVPAVPRHWRSDWRWPGGLRRGLRTEGGSGDTVPSLLVAAADGVDDLS